MTNYIIELKKEKKRIWNLVLVDQKSHETIFVRELKLIPILSISSSFEKVSELIKKMSESLGDEFVNWFLDLFNKYSETKDSNLILDNIDNFVKYSVSYLSSLNIPYSSFCTEKKRSKTSIVFTEDDIRKILEASVVFKLYSIYIAESELRLDETSNKEFKKEIVSKIGLDSVLNKIYSVIKSRINRSSVSDRYIWMLVKNSINITPDNYAMDVFNYFCNSLFPILDINSNPISYLVKITDDSINWIICSRYKDRIIFNPESFSNIDEVFSKAISKETLEMFCCNDLLKRVAENGLSILERRNGAQFGSTKFQIVQERLNSIVQIPLATQLVLYPVINKALKVPFRYIETTSPRILLLVGVALKESLASTIGQTYPIIYSFLTAYSKTFKIIRRSSYKLKKTDVIINSSEKIFGLSSSVLKYEILSNISGLLISSHKKLYDLVTDARLPKFNNSEVEDQVIDFYNRLYSGKLDKILVNYFL